MLRIFLADPPNDDAPLDWIRYSSDGRAVSRGRDVPRRLPSREAMEVVLAASHVRLVTLELPPMPRARRMQAVRYALEDQMATSAEEAAIAVAGTERRALVAITSKTWVSSVAACLPQVSRIVPESALAPFAEGWSWYASAGDGGFIRREDGSAFAVGTPDDALPSELQAALVAARRGESATPVVRAALPVATAEIATWSQTTGTRFVAAPAWHWEQATADAFASAPDFLAHDVPPETLRPGYARPFRLALSLAALALVLHVGGLLTQWATITFTDWQLSRALVREAVDAGISSVTNGEAAAAALASRNATVMHRAGKHATQDALPLLARAAPAIGALPRAMLKSMTYAGDAWTVELAGADAATISRLSRNLDDQGVRSVSAPVAGGTRMRLTLDALYR